MSVLVLALNRGKVLLGTGGKWYREGKSQAEQATIAAMQRTSATDPDTAVTDLIATAPPGVRIGPVVKKNGYYSTRFIDPSKRGNPWGFIKGTFPDTNYPGETAEAAARREFEEETSTPLTEPLTEVAPTIFRVTVDDAKADAILRTWRTKSREGYGELVNLEWVPIQDVRKDLNPESMAALAFLPGWKAKGGIRVFSGGQLKMAKTRRTARQTRSRCSTVCRPSMCKRTRGCTQAAGPKRRFCRTAKNRKSR
jgi:hypothetical protein